MTDTAMNFRAPSAMQGQKALIGTRSLVAWAVVTLLLMAAAALSGHRLALQAGEQGLRESAGHRLDLMASGLDSQLSRFDFLPSLLEMAPNVRRLLASPDDPALRDEVNRYLNGINATAGAEMLYVLDRDGMALAAADWNQPGTTVGTALGFRPYVQEALARGRGRFYGMGITSKRPGYYLSYALTSGRQLLGVAAVKVSLADAEQSWSQLPGSELLLDERGVVILSNREQWKFRPLQPLSAQAMAAVTQGRPYGEASLRPIDWEVLEPRAGDAQIVRVEGVDHLASFRAVNAGRWRLVLLDDLAPARAAARNVAITAALTTCVALLLLLVAWQRRRGRQALRASQVALQAAHDSLESRVLERTAELRKAQADLVHAEKMAALGQMSAGLVHELNQPLAAMRSLSDNVGVLLDHRREAEARENLQRISRLLDRLAKLTRQLKLFARKPSGTPAPVALRPVIASAQVLHAQRIAAAGIQVQVDVAAGADRVLADEAQLEQVIVNLVGNAIDAMEGAPQRRLDVQAAARGGQCVLTFSDTGPGIRADILPRLFEPFVTGKPAGAGLGLGLVISANILRDFGGSLSGRNLDRGGACFELRLPLATIPLAEQALHA